MKLMKSALVGATMIALPITGLSTAAQAADTYAFDMQGAHAAITFKVPHLGFSYIFGRFNAFDGTIELDEANPENSKVSVTVDTASLDSNHAKRDKHIRSNDFVDAAKHPKATFVSTKVVKTGDKTADVTGDFTFMGITKPLTLKVEHVGGGKDPWGGQRQGFNITGSFSTADYGMQSPIAANMTVDLDMSIEGIKQ